MIKSIFKLFAYFLIVFLLLVASWFFWEHHRDHLAALDMGAYDVIFINDSLTTTPLIQEPREYHDINLYSEKTGNITFYLSLPPEIPQEGLPVIIILGGLQIGRYNFSFIENPAQNIIVIYKYPYDRSNWYEGMALFEIAKIRNAVLSVPAQVVEVIKWLQKQSWYDGQKLSVAGYSFGALFTPAVYRLANRYNVSIKQGIISYGGADIYEMLRANLKKHNPLSRELIARIASTAINSVDPKHHLPFMSNEFLIINGKKDKQIPKECWLLLHELTPEPKTIMILDEGHMHTRKPELTKKLVDLSREWLVEKGVLNH